MVLQRYAVRPARHRDEGLFGLVYRRNVHRPGANREIIAPLVAMGGVPPVLISANVDGSDEHNAAIQKRYKGRV